jgi:DNA-binding FrmR family transcriptional regulator
VPPPTDPATWREFDIAARSYRAGLARLQPRADRLADAVQTMLAAGHPPRDVLALLALVGLAVEDLPARLARQLAADHVSSPEGLRAGER